VVVVVAATFLLWGQFRDGRPLSWALTLLAAGTLVGAVGASWKGREGWAFALTGTTLALTVASLFATLYPNVMPSSTDAAYSLTVDNASSTDYTLKVMTVVALAITPGGAVLPGLDLLGVPQADQQPPHPCGAVAGARRAVIGGAQRQHRELTPACAPSTRGC
jgi:hypothetical protein